MSASSSLGAVACLIVAMFSFQAGASIAKGLFPIVGAPGTTAWRLTGAVLMLCIVQRPWRSRPSRQALPSLVAYGLALGSMNFVFYQALKTVPLGIAVGLEFTGPLAVALAASRRRLDLVWVALAVAGLLCLLPLERTSAHLDLTGVVWALTAGAFWALYIVFGQRAGRAHGPTAATWGLMVAALAIAPIGVWDAGTRLLSHDVWPRGLAIAVLSSALPYTLEMIALRQLSARVYGTLMSLEPAGAALVGLVLLQERLSLVQWVGIVAVMMASAGALGQEQTVGPEL